MTFFTGADYKELIEAQEAMRLLAHKDTLDAAVRLVGAICLLVDDKEIDTAPKRIDAARSELLDCMRQELGQK